MAVDLDLVLRKIAQVFPDRDWAEILARLDEYGTQPYEREQRRVQLAILKLCQESGPDQLEEFIRVAKWDYRDVLAWAEYPRQMRVSPNVDAERRADLIQQDSEQYRAWLEDDSDD